MLTKDEAYQFAEHWVAAWNAHDLDRIMSHYEAEVELISPVAAQLVNAPEGAVAGKINLRAYFQKGLTAFPELHFELRDVMWGVKSIVLYYANQRGTHTGEYMELSPRGKVVRWWRTTVADRGRRWTLLLLGLGSLCLALSAMGAHDRLTWVLEVSPILLAVPVLVLTGRRFPLTSLAYVLIFVHALVLMVGGHYTYERVPLGFWIERALHLGRNDYDRIGHFAQGFVPAILTREVLLRRSPLVPGKWLFFLVTAVCLAISAAYELFEWGAAVTLGSGADAFLATQGDPWDTQWDMLTALVGAVVAQLALGRVHDRQLRGLGGGNS